MKMASAPPLTKARPAPPCAGAGQGVKRTAEEGTEVLEERTTAEQAVVSTAAPESAGVAPEARSEDPKDSGVASLRSTILTELKSVAMENIRSVVAETYKKSNIEITAQEISNIASLS